MDTKKLRQKILDLAIRGKLVPQDPNDEPAIELFKRINPKFEPCINELDDIQLPDSWCWTTLESVSTDSADGPFGSNLKKEHYTSNKEVRIIQLSNIGEEGWREENTKYTTFEHLKDISRSEVLPNDIVIAKMMPAGRAILCPNNEQKYVLSSDAVKFHIVDNVDCRYIRYAINSDMFRKQVYENVQGVTRVRTSLQKLRKYCLPIPPYQEQLCISNEIKRWFTLIDELESNEDDLLKAINKAKSKILDLAIHGKLVPQDPNDEPAIELLKHINPKFNSCDGEDDVPEGWEVASFKTVCDTISSKPYQILQSEIKDSGKFPVISQSANYIEGYSDREECVLQVKNPVLIFGDHTRVLKYVDFDFIVGADGVKIIQTKLTPKYVYYVLLCTIHKIQGKGYARHFSILSNTLIPVPPREEQLRIVVKIEEVFKALDALS